jgi:SAM-dependent methyltransferase
MTSETDWTAPRGVMLGGGDYDRHSELQGGVLELAAGCLERAVLALGARDVGQPFCLADYGAATGKNSVSVMRRIGALFRGALGREPPLVITFCDQTGNDWNALAERLEAAFGSRDDVNTLMSAGSFYGSVLPSCSVDLAWSASSVHWLGRSPALTSAGLWPHPDLPGRGPFVEQAARDWESFLRERARELRPGGQLVVVAAAAGADGRSPADHYLDPVWETLLELERDGELGTSERARMFVPTYFRSAGEYRAPFDDPTLPLELVEYAEAPLPDALWQVYERTGEPAELARAWVGWLRAFSAPLLGRALDARRDGAQKRAFLDELYRRLEQQIVKEPARARVPWQTALVHAVRSG